jgi:hypothetical protein
VLALVTRQLTPGKGGGGILSYCENLVFTPSHMILLSSRIFCNRSYRCKAVRKISFPLAGSPLLRCRLAKCGSQWQERVHRIHISGKVKVKLPLTVAARPKAWTVFARSNTGVVDSNPTRGMDVCMHLFCVCVALCIGSGLATGWSPVQGDLPCIGLRNWKAAKAQQRAVEP